MNEKKRGPDCTVKLHSSFLCQWIWQYTIPSHKEPPTPYTTLSCTCRQDTHTHTCTWKKMNMNNIILNQIASHTCQWSINLIKSCNSSIEWQCKTINSLQNMEVKCLMAGSMSRTWTMRNVQSADFNKWLRVYKIVKITCAIYNT